MKKTLSLTQGNILGTLIRFAVPVFFTLFLQALYGGVDLLVVGQFASTADVSGVATGSMLLSTVTMIITGLSMGITILVGERICSSPLNFPGNLSVLIRISSLRKSVWGLRWLSRNCWWGSLFW